MDGLFFKKRAGQLLSDPLGIASGRTIVGCIYDDFFVFWVSFCEKLKTDTLVSQTVDKVSFGHGCSKGCALELGSSRRNLFPATCKKPDL